MSKKLIVITSALIFLVSLFVAKNALAIIRCETQYEGEVCWEIRLEINKEVWNPAKNEFADNLVDITGTNPDIYKFAPGEEITYQLTVKNVGDEKLDKVNVKDYLPDYLTFVSGDHEFEIYDLDVDESVTKEFKAKVVNEENLPNVSPICDDNTRNRARAWTDDLSDEDTAQICIVRKVLAAELPPTGPQNAILLLGFSLLSGLTGISLLRKRV